MNHTREVFLSEAMGTNRLGIVAQPKQIVRAVGDAGKWTKSGHEWTEVDQVDGARNVHSSPLCPLAYNNALVMLR